MSDNLILKRFANTIGRCENRLYKQLSPQTQDRCISQPLGCLEAFASTKLRLGGELGDIWEVAIRSELVAVLESRPSDNAELVTIEHVRWVSCS